MKKLTRTELKSIRGGDNCGAGVPCQNDWPDCGMQGHCVNGYCDNSWGGGSSCQDGNNGGCHIDRICITTPNGTMCI